MTLVTSCEERFGKKTKLWFTPEAVEEAKDQVYNRVTNTVDVDEVKWKTKMDIFAAFGDHATPAARLNADATGAIIPEYHGDFDSDTDSDDEEEPTPKATFELQMLFNLTPSLSGAGGMDDQNSIGTNATGTSNATEMILAGGIGTQFDGINMDGDSVASSLTGTTRNTPPHQPRQLNVSPKEKEEDDKMEQEEQQKGENDMDLDKDGTEKDNEEKQQTDPDATMATGDGSNEHEGEDPRNNGNGDINDCSEERKDSNDNEGGGGGKGG